MDTEDSLSLAVRLALIIHETSSIFDLKKLLPACRVGFSHFATLGEQGVNLQSVSKPSLLVEKPSEAAISRHHRPDEGAF
jgi:hypothetical protein